MALSQMGKFCLSSARHSIFNKNKVIINSKTIRSFKRGRKNLTVEEEVKISGSLETPFSNVHVESGDMSIKKLWKPLAFTIGFSGTSFVGCAIWEYESMRAHAISMIKRPVKFFKKHFDQGIERSNAWSKEARKFWSSLTPGQKVFVPICALNTLVFVAWRIPRLQPTMLKYFASNPASPHQCLPMILSTFSHYSGLHLLANMYVLHSFSTGAVHNLGKEQFLALYLSAGVISSFTSYLYKILRKQPGLSLGASGSIMAVLAYVCMQFPETQLGIILLPIVTFSAGSAIKFIVGLDMAGVIMGWKFFDHAAHLGGAATGIAWAMYGNQSIWPKREPILRYWHELRGSIK